LIGFVQPGADVHRLESAVVRPGFHRPGCRITDVGTHSELLQRNEHYRYVISSLEDEELAAEERAERELRRAEEQSRRQDAIDRESRVIDQDGEGIR